MIPRSHTQEEVGWWLLFLFAQAYENKKKEVTFFNEFAGCLAKFVDFCVSFGAGKFSVLELCGVGARCGVCACFGYIASPPITSLRDLPGSQETVKGGAAAGRLCNSLAEGFPMPGLLAKIRTWRYLMIFREPGVPVWRWGAAVVLAVLALVSGISIPFSSV